MQYESHNYTTLQHLTVLSMEFFHRREITIPLVKNLTLI